MRQRLRISVYATLILVGLGCSTTRVVEIIKALVGSIEVAPPAANLSVGKSVQLQAVPRDTAGNPLPEQPVTWSSSNSAIANVNTSGLVTAAAVGVAFVVATSEGKSDTSMITATAVQVGSVAVTPPSATVDVGRTAQLQATVRDTDGGTLTGRVVTWTTSNPGVATVSNAGLVTGVAAGSATVTATSEGQSGSATITVTMVPVASVTVTPATASVDSSKTVQLTAALRDANGGTLTGRTVTWTSLNPGVATVSSSGLVTGVKSGTADVYALSEGKSDTATITVVTPPPPPPPAPVASVTVTPASVTVETSRTAQLTATLRDANGTTLTGRTVTWTSLSPSVATVTSNGLVTGVTVGTANVYALSEGKSDTAVITVVAPPPPPPPPPPGLRAFPGAQGFGSSTPAGRGGTIVRVTNLNDTGAGSLRAALSVPGPVVIIFEVSGTIRVGENLVVTHPFTTIAGQTAPSPGITLRGGTFRINTHDVLIQHLRFRPGDEPGFSRERDGIEFYGGTQEKYNIVLDHCSISWGVDENLSTGTSSSGVRHDITFSNLIIAEGLNNSIHPEGAHSKGVLIGQGSKNITFMGNLMAHHVDRNPWFKGNTTGFIVNNVIYNYGGSKATFFDDVDNTALQMASVVGNVYLRGVDSPTGRPIRIYSGVKPGSLFYVADNSWDRAAPPSDPWALVNNEEGAAVVATTPPIWIPGLVVQPNASVESWVLSNAGARPADRDAVDLRIVQEVRTNTGRIIDSPSQVGGWPTLAENRRPLVTPTNPNGDDDGDGYTNLEEWLHRMAAEVEGRPIP